LLDAAFEFLLVHLATLASPACPSPPAAGLLLLELQLLDPFCLVFYVTMILLVFGCGLIWLCWFMFLLF
jgi:hypothetical protein